MTATDERYNGWRNYETWAAALWLGNDEDDECGCSTCEGIRADRAEGVPA